MDCRPHGEYPNGQLAVTRVARKWPLAGVYSCTAQNAFLLFEPIMNAWRAIQFGAAKFRIVYRVCYRVFTASPPMRPSKAGPLNGGDFGSLLSWC